MSSKTKRLAQKQVVQTSEDPILTDKVSDWLIFGGESPLPMWPDIADTVLVVDRTTGCHFIGSKLIHTHACVCGDYE